MLQQLTRIMEKQIILSMIPKEKKKAGIILHIKLSEL